MGSGQCAQVEDKSVADSERIERFRQLRGLISQGRWPYFLEDQWPGRAGPAKLRPDEPMLSWSLVRRRREAIHQQCERCCGNRWGQGLGFMGTASYWVVGHLINRFSGVWTQV